MNNNQTDLCKTIIRNDIVFDIIRVSGNSDTLSMKYSNYYLAGIFTIDYILNYFTNWNEVKAIATDYKVRQLKHLLDEGAEPVHSIEGIKKKRKKNYFYNGLFLRKHIDKSFGTWKPLLWRKDYDYSEFTKTQILADINRVSKLIGSKMVLRYKYLAIGKFNLKEIESAFTSWTKAEKLADVKTLAIHISKEDIIADLISVSTRIGTKYIIIDDYKKHGKYSYSITYYRFGSWKNAVIAAGLEFKEVITKSDLLKDLKKVADYLKVKNLTKSDYLLHGKYKMYHYKLAFGTWNKALISMKLKPIHPTPEHLLLADLKRVAKMVSPQLLTSNNYTKLGNFCPSTMVYRFGSWSKAMSKAELEMNQINTNRMMNSTDDELLDDLKSVAALVGINKFSLRIYSENGKFSFTLFYKRFGSWNAAVLKAGLPVKKRGGIKSGD